MSRGKASADEGGARPGFSLVAARRAILTEMRQPAGSPYWPALAAALYSLVFIPRGAYSVGSPLLHALRAAPTSPLVCGLLFAWIYRRELSSRKAAWGPTSAALAGAALAPLFYLAFAYGRFSAGPLLRNIEARLWARLGLEPVLEALAIPLGGWPLLPGGDPLLLRWAGMAGEELFFRGVVFGLIRAKGGSFAKAAAVSALAFALWHGDPTQVPYYLVWGLAVAAVYERTGSLWTPIALHLGYNALLAVGHASGA